MIIQHNLPAMNSHRQMGINNNSTSKNLEKLSSGFKINRAGDDAAGLAISEKMRGQIRGLNMATQNANNGISLIQTAEGGLNETHDILQRMRELAVQSSNGTYDANDRMNLQKEVDALSEEITRISSATNYNGISLLDGSLNGGNKATITGNTDVLKSVILDDTQGAGAITVSVDKADLIKTTTDEKASFKLTIAAPTAGSSSPGDDVKVTLGGVEKTINFDDNDTTAINVATKVAAAFGSDFDITDNGDGTLDIKAKTNGAVVEADFAKIKFDDDATTFKATGVASTFVNGSTAGTEVDLEKIQINGSDADSATINGNLIVAKDATGNSFTIDTSKLSDTASENDATVTVEVGGGNPLTFQIGANGDPFHQVTLSVGDMSADGLGVGSIDVSTQGGAKAAIDTLETAINAVSSQRAGLGALQNRLEHTVNNLGTTRENLQAAEASIRDVDMAKEMMEFTKNNILVQASQSMLAQSNQLPQGVLQLLR